MTGRITWVPWAAVPGWWKVQESLTNTREDDSCLHGILIKIAPPPLPNPHPHSLLFFFFPFFPPPTLLKWVMISSSWAHPASLRWQIHHLDMCHCIFWVWGHFYELCASQSVTVLENSTVCVCELLWKSVLQFALMGNFDRTDNPNPLIH